MRKLFTLVLATTVLCALFCGCGTTDTTETSEDQQTQSEDILPENSPDASSDTNEQAIGTEASADSASATVAEENTDPIPLDVNSTTEVKDQYILSCVQVDSSPEYYYVKSTEIGATILTWTAPEGYTPVSVRVTIENHNPEVLNFLENVGGTFVFDGGTTVITTALQENSGQTAEDGNVYPSTKAVPLENGQTAVLWMIGNVPADLLNSNEGAHSYFILNDGTMYDIDLRTGL